MTHSLADYVTLAVIVLTVAVQLAIVVGDYLSKRDKEMETRK